jgi:putative addiction module component (TIGR02574 family)
MGRHELWAELMKLTPAERIELAEDLWESVEPEDVPPLTAEQKKELDRRLAEHERDPSTALTWDEVKARLQSRLK